MLKVDVKGFDLKTVMLRIFTDSCSDEHAFFLKKNDVTWNLQV